jgi:hypothetical protein
MSTVKRHASTILGAFEQARTELIGKAGTVENVWLDEFHGLRILSATMGGGLSQLSSSRRARARRRTRRFAPN